MENKTSTGRRYISFDVFTIFVFFFYLSISKMTMIPSYLVLSFVYHHNIVKTVNQSKEEGKYKIKRKKNIKVWRIYWAYASVCHKNAFNEWTRQNGKLNMTGNQIKRRLKAIRSNYIGKRPNKLIKSCWIEFSFVFDLCKCLLISSPYPYLSLIHQCGPKQTNNKNK